MSSNEAQATFDKLMQRPDIEQATQRYQQMQQEILAELSKQFPSLVGWRTEGELAGAACDQNSYPGLQLDGQTRALPRHTNTTVLSDPDYNRALAIVGSIAARYGFNKQPQRLYDAPKRHDAAFHNVHDDGRIDVNVNQGLSIGLSVGCYLTAEAKRRGHPAES